MKIYQLVVKIKKKYYCFQLDETFVAVHVLYKLQLIIIIIDNKIIQAFWGKIWSIEGRIVILFSQGT